MWRAWRLQSWRHVHLVHSSSSREQQYCFSSLHHRRARQALSSALLWSMPMLRLVSLIFALPNSWFFPIGVLLILWNCFFYFPCLFPLLGWGNHYMSKRKYHWIIPIDCDWNKPLEDGVFDLQTHILHGLIHCNGFGHLLSINGIEGGSGYLCGREIMDLWDRICTNLRTW